MTMRQVHVVFRGKGTMFMARDSLAWLIAYMANEIELGGVGLIDEDAAVAANCEVPNLHVKWDFGDGSWMGEFVHEELQGSRYSCAVRDMTPARWARTDLAEKTPFERASFHDRREGARLFLQAHCAALAAETHCAAVAAVDG